MPYQAEIIRNKKVSIHDLREGEYVINEFAGQIKGVLKLNGRLHSTIFNEQTNKAPLKSEKNDIVINDGMHDRVVIGDIGKTKDGNLFGMKISKPGYNARFAPENKLLINTAKNFLWPAFSVYQSSSVDEQSLATGTWTRITLDSENYDKGSNFASNYFTAPYDGIYHFDAKILLDGNYDTDAGDFSSEDRLDCALFKSNKLFLIFLDFFNLFSSDLLKLKTLNNLLKNPSAKMFSLFIYDFFFNIVYSPL